MSNPAVLTTCRKCNQAKERILIKVYKDGSKFYKGPDGRKWLGQTCPDCSIAQRKGYYKNREHATANCQICSKSFEQKHSNQIYCSTPCTMTAHKSIRQSKSEKVGKA